MEGSSSEGESDIAMSMSISMSDEGKGTSLSCFAVCCKNRARLDQFTTVGGRERRAYISRCVVDLFSELAFDGHDSLIVC